MPFEPLTQYPDHLALEGEILAWWDDQGIFDQLRKRNSGGPTFSFMDGPITANNPMGAHHCWGRTLKDLFQRYKAFRGFDQRYQNGFDCQGLWVEVGVERSLGLNSKREIEEYGLAEFNERCKERVAEFAEIIGYPREEVRGLMFQEITPDEDGVVCLSSFQKLWTGASDAAVLMCASLIDSSGRMGGSPWPVTGRSARSG